MGQYYPHFEVGIEKFRAATIVISGNGGEPCELGWLWHLAEMETRNKNGFQLYLREVRSTMSLLGYCE